MKIGRVLQGVDTGKGGEESQKREDGRLQLTCPDHPVGYENVQKITWTWGNVDRGEAKSRANKTLMAVKQKL